MIRCSSHIVSSITDESKPLRNVDRPLEENKKASRKNFLATDMHWLCSSGCRLPSEERSNLPTASAMESTYPKELPTNSL